jgi:Uma2 family endonuclease
MTARKLPELTLEEYLVRYEGTRNEYVDGQIVELAPTTSYHGDAQAGFAEILRAAFHKKRGGPGDPPGGWWLRTEAAVRYGQRHLFAHDLAGWRRDLHPSKPSGYPVLERPDWVCEMLSTNVRDDKERKKAILHEWQVPHFWLVDPIGQEIRILAWEEKDYRVVGDYGIGFMGELPPFNAAPLAVRDLFGVEDDETLE